MLPNRTVLNPVFPEKENIKAIRMIMRLDFICGLFSVFRIDRLMMAGVQQQFTTAENRRQPGIRFQNGAVKLISPASLMIRGQFRRIRQNAPSISDIHFLHAQTDSGRWNTIRTSFRSAPDQSFILFCGNSKARPVLRNRDVALTVKSFIGQFPCSSLGIYTVFFISQTFFHTSENRSSVSGKIG